MAVARLLVVVLACTHAVLLVPSSQGMTTTPAVLSVSNGNADASDTVEYMRDGIRDILSSENVSMSYSNCLQYAYKIMTVNFSTHVSTSTSLPNDPRQPGSDAANLFGFIMHHIHKTQKTDNETSDRLCSVRKDNITLFCDLVFDKELHCDPVVPGGLPTGICLYLYYYHGLLAPLVLTNQIHLSPGARFLSKHFCPPRSFDSCAVLPESGSNDPSRAACVAPFVRVSEKKKLSKVYERNCQFARYRVEVATNGTLRFFEPLPEEMLCADRCMAGIYPSNDVVFLSHLARACYIVQTLLPILLVLAAIRSGPRAAWEYPNRLMLYLALNIFVYGSHLLPHFLEGITGRGLTCQQDYTVLPLDRLNESSLCVYSNVAYIFGRASYRLVFLFVSFCWWHLVLQLQRVHRWRCLTELKLDGAAEIMVFVLILVWSTVMAALFAQGPFEVSNVVHICVSVGSYSNWMVVAPDMLALLLSFLLMFDGCRRLTLIRRRSNNLAREMGMHSEGNGDNVGNGRVAAAGSHANTAVQPLANVGNSLRRRLSMRLHSAFLRPSSHGRSNRKADRAMLKLLSRLFLILLGLLLAGSTSDVLVILLTQNAVPDISFRVESDDFKDQRVSYEHCRIATCGTDAKCDQLQDHVSSQWLVMSITYISLDIINALLICAGVFSPKTWKRKLSQGERRKQHWRSVAKASFASRFANGVTNRRDVSLRYSSDNSVTRLATRAINLRSRSLGSGSQISPMEGCPPVLPCVVDGLSHVSSTSSSGHRERESKPSTSSTKSLLSRVETSL